MFQSSGYKYKNIGYNVKTKILRVEHTSQPHTLNFEFSHTRTYMYIYIYMYIYMYVCICMYVFMYVCMFVGI